MNELSLIFGKMGLSTKDVLDTAATKWNFHRYSPGLVGGHCIPVNPYYLVYKANDLGYHPQVILAGRARYLDILKVRELLVYTIHQRQWCAVASEEYGLF